MVVYADILIFLNTVINFYLVNVTAKVCRNNERLPRLVAGSFVGALFSLYIFLPKQSFFLELAVRLVCSGIIILISFGFISIKRFLKSIAAFYVSSFIFAGLMLGVWYLFKPGGMIIHNSIVYFSISPLLLLLLSTLAYVLIVLFRRLFINKISESRYCKLEICSDSKSISTTAVIDSGHTVTDIFSGADVIFLNESLATDLFGCINPDLLNDDLKRRYRVIPYKTVSGDGLINAFRSDKAVITCNNVATVIKNPVIAVTGDCFPDDYKALISPHTIEKS